MVFQRARNGGLFFDLPIAPVYQRWAARPVAGGVSVLIEQLDIPWPAGMGGMEECAGEQSQDDAARTVIERRTGPAVQAYRGSLVE